MTTPKTRAAQAKTPRTEGQWAPGDREPLNVNEQVKQDDDGLNVRKRIEEVYCRTGVAGIDPTDRRSRFRWWGLYTQRAPGIEGGRTATLPPEELEDEHFMLRIRIDGGALTTEQLGVVGEVSRLFARDTADLTDRQNIQLHWIRVEDLPEIWRRLEGAGLTTAESAGDTPRVVLGSPMAGIAVDEVLDATPALHEITRRLIANPRVLQPAAQVQNRHLRPPRRGPRDQRCGVHRCRPSGSWPGTGCLGRRRPVDESADRRAPRRMGTTGRRARRVDRNRLPLPRLRVSATAGEGALEVPRLGLGVSRSSATCSKRNTSDAQCSMDQHPNRSTNPAITSVSSVRRTVSTPSGSHPSWAGSAAPC